MFFFVSRRQNAEEKEAAERKAASELFISLKDPNALPNFYNKELNSDLKDKSILNYKKMVTSNLNLSEYSMNPPLSSSKLSSKFFEELNSTA